MTPSIYFLPALITVWLPVKTLLSLREEPDPTLGTLGERIARSFGNCIQRTGELICHTTVAGTMVLLGSDRFLGKDFVTSCLVYLPQVGTTMCVGLMCEIWGQVLKHLAAPAPEKLPHAPAKLNGSRPVSSLPRIANH